MEVRVQGEHHHMIAGGNEKVDRVGEDCQLSIFGMILAESGSQLIEL